jgi:hypothetical protein
MLAAVLLTCAVRPPRAAAVELISIDLGGAAGNAASNGVAVNANGTFVAFYSDATDLIPNDTNQFRDVFVRDRAQQTTERISVNSLEEPANRACHATGFAPAINADGQIVAFYSDATNLTPNDTNGQTDVFVRLRASGDTDLVSLASDGSQGSGPSLNPSIDGIGRFVAFQSQASNLAPNDTNAVSDIFVRDRDGLSTERICDSIEPNNFSFAPSISANGNFVAFTSAATNLVPVDENRQLDIFVCDRSTGQIDLVSVSTEGVQGNRDSILPAISEDGRFVAFKSLASNLVPDDRNDVVDVFVRDRQARTTERVSVSFFGGDANDASFPPSISYDGRFVAFGSAAGNIVRADVNLLPSVFVRDRLASITLLVDVNDAGEQANGATLDVPPSVSGDGRHIGYVSLADNLKGPDLNETVDVFIADNPFPPPSVCCQCGVACELGGVDGCPPGCTPVEQAVCLDPLEEPRPSSLPGNCATFTPTPLVTPTPTSTASTTSTGKLTATPTPTSTPIGTLTETITPEVTPTASFTGTTVPTSTATASIPPTPSGTPTGSVPLPASPTHTATPTSTRLETPATVTPTPTAVGSETPGVVTATPTRTRTLTPVRTATATPTGSVGPTVRLLDEDACQCAVSPTPRRTARGVTLWLSGPLALLLRRRRRRG